MTACSPMTQHSRNAPAQKLVDTLTASLETTSLASTRSPVPLGRELKKLHRGLQI